MYLGKRKLFNPEGHEANRREVMEYKDGAVWTVFLELDGLINRAQLAKQYMNKSQSWLAQKLNGCTVCNKTVSFTEAEYHQLAEAFREISRRLAVYADEIDAAKMDD